MEDNLILNVRESRKKQTNKQLKDSCVAKDIKEMQKTSGGGRGAGVGEGRNSELV